MMNYLLIRHLLIENATALQNEFIVGTPSMTQYNGCFDKLERFLNENGINISFDGFAISYHKTNMNNLYNGSYGKKSIILNSKTMLKSGKNPSTSEMPTINFEASFLIRFNGDIDEEKEVKELLYSFFESYRVCGGFLKGYKYKSNPFEILYTDDTNNSVDREVLKKLMLGYVLIDKSNLLLEYTQNEPSKDTLETMIDLLTIDKDKENKKLEKGIIVPMVIGYRGFGSPSHVANQRDCSKKHQFVETITTACEYILPMTVSCIDDILWKRSYIEKDNLYIIRNKNSDNKLDLVI